VTTEAPSLSLAFNLPPEQAVEYFRAKGMRITSKALDMAAAAHAKSFTVAGVLKAEVLEDIRAALDGAMAEGKTYEQFLKELRPKLQSKGWWGIPHDPETGEVLKGRAMTPRRLRTVYQTNLQSAFMAGRYKAQLENSDQRPYWQYVAVMDNRTRPAHRSLNGRVFRYDDEAWSSLYPPNGYNCRCRVRALSQGDFESEGISLSKGTGRMETNEVNLGGKRGKVSVTGYREPGSNTLFSPDPGFDHNPGQGAFGLDVELARKVQAMKSPEIRSQVWQGLNNSAERLAAYNRWVDNHLGADARPGHSAQVVGFIDDAIAGFMERQMPEAFPVRVVAINEKRLAHAASAKHQEAGIALTQDQYLALPGIVSKPDAVYFDLKHRHFALVRELEDGVIYAALEVDDNLKQVGRLDALVNAYRLKNTAEGAGRLQDANRYIKMGESGR